MTPVFDMCSTQHIVIKGLYSHLYSLSHTQKCKRFVVTLYCILILANSFPAIPSTQATRNVRNVWYQSSNQSHTDHISYYQITHHKANDITVVHYSPY